jgi:hypothetical protein
MTDIPTIDNYEIAGEYLRKLSLNESPEPAAGDLKNKLAQNSVNIPDNMTATLNRDPDDTFNIMIRDEETLRAEWEAISQPGGNYQMPPDLEAAYKDYIENRHLYEGTTAAHIAKRQKLFRIRLADYTFGTCAG